MNNVNELITQEEYYAWRKEPMTKIFFQYLERVSDINAERVKQSVLLGFEIPEKERVEITYSCAIIRKILLLEHDDLNVVLQPEEIKK